MNSPWVLNFLFAMMGLLEKLFLVKGRRQYFKLNREEVNTLLLTGLNGLAWSVLPTHFSPEILVWIQNHRLFDFSSLRFVGGILLFFAFDFCYYWLHRLEHGFKPLWFLHGIHHSPSHVTILSAGMRGVVVEGLLISFSLFFVLLFFGFDVVMVSVLFFWAFNYQILIHNRAFRGWGIADKILATPKSHRVHHLCTAPEFQNKNFGILTLCWDRLFGTYLEHKELPGERYGISPYDPEERTFSDIFKKTWRLGE